LQPLYLAEKQLPELLVEMRLRGDRQLAIVDCGPGTLDDGRLHLNLISSEFEISSYLIVDVNSSLLESVASGLASDNTCRGVSTIRRKFEDLDRSALAIPNDSDALFIFGSTAMNFDPEHLNKVIRRMTTSNDLVAFQALLRTEAEAVIHVDRYRTPEIFDFTFGPLALAGADRESLVPEFRWLRDRVEFLFRAKDATKLRLDSIPHLDSGDLVLTGFSRRPTLREHEDILKSLFSKYSLIVSSDGVATSIGLVW
jgi:hypothetical protein